MTARDWFILFFTLVVGMLAGAYFYVTAYAPNYVSNDVPEKELSASEFSIIGAMYGGMVANFIHPSFDVAGDGSYSYYPGGVDDSKEETGELPRKLLDALQSALVASDLVTIARPAEPDKTCVSYADGIEYEYFVEVKGIEFELDTCQTAFSNDTELGKTLLEVWRFMENPNEYRFTITNNPDVIEEELELPSLRGYLERGFEEARSGE